MFKKFLTTDNENEEVLLNTQLIVSVTKAITPGVVCLTMMDGNYFYVKTDIDSIHDQLNN